MHTSRRNHSQYNHEATIIYLRVWFNNLQMSCENALLYLDRALSVEFRDKDLASRKTFDFVQIIAHMNLVPDD